MNIENELKKLEIIADKLENETVSLEESIKLYKEGKKLVNDINEQINTSKLEVKRIDGEVFSNGN
jgi:exodeoxyribonuclease VII small subunit